VTYSASSTPEREPDAPQSPRTVSRLADRESCLGCGLCVDACPHSAIELNDVVTVREDLCTGCGDCVEVCPQDALTLVTI
jgi:ferredoxin